MISRIKYCGLRDAEAIAHADAQGASFVGFVHHPASPRHLPLEAMAKLARHVPPSLKHVAVMVAPDDTLLQNLFQYYRPDYLQVHQVTDPRRIAEMASVYNVPVISALAIRSAEDIAPLAALETAAEHVLFDAKNFGSGQAFDWNILARARPLKPWFLAGGLTPENVTEAIITTRAPMVDVSSGIEVSPGVKSAEKIAAFHRAVLEARP